MKSTRNRKFDLFHLKIISGGQSGAGRAGLDVAIARGLPYGGWCPEGRTADDGPLSNRYLLAETSSAEKLACTSRNLADSDATVFFTLGGLSGMNRLEVGISSRHNRPLLHLALSSMSENVAIGRLAAFIHAHQIKRLNVAGSRERIEPGIHTRVCTILWRAFDKLGVPSPETLHSSSDERTAMGQGTHSPWRLTVEEFCGLYARRASHWTTLMNDPELTENSRQLIRDCIPLLKTDGSVITDILPGGADLLTFLSHHGHSIQLNWFPTKVGIHISRKDSGIVFSSGVYDFQPNDSPIMPLGDGFDEIVVNMILNMK